MKETKLSNGDIKQEFTCDCGAKYSRIQSKPTLQEAWAQATESEKIKFIDSLPAVLGICSSIEYKDNPNVCGLCGRPTCHGGCFK